MIYFLLHFIQTFFQTLVFNLIGLILFLFLSSRQAFQQAIESLANQPRKPESRLFVWIVDTVNESKGLTSLRPLLPSIQSLTVESFILNPPGIQLYHSFILFLIIDVPKHSKHSILPYHLLFLRESLKHHMEIFVNAS